MTAATPETAASGAAVRERYSVARPLDFWYPVSPSDGLGRGPQPIALLSMPLVLYRDGDGTARALVDRCPHRNLALSLGKVLPSGRLRCAYHGWEFDGAGRCRHIPGLVEDEEGGPGRDADSLATRESDGFVWAWGRPGATPQGEPFRVPRLEGQRADTFVLTYDMRCTLHAAVENALDVPHTAFLHSGRFRGEAPREIRAERRPLPGGVEVEYIGEPLRIGPKRYRREDVTFEHWDRFFLPSIAQVEYKAGDDIHVMNTLLHLPIDEFLTRAWLVVTFRLPFPRWVAKPILRYRVDKVVRQDVDVLARQTETLRRFGGERYTSTAIDLMGREIWTLLRRAERGDDTAPAVAERSIRMQI